MKYHDITKDDMKNGDGLRAVLWVSGCEHHCENCQNPITWDAQSGLEFDAEAKEELFGVLDKDYISGLTLSGGDPLYPDNISDITSLCKEVKEKYPHKTIWLYSGYNWEKIKELEIVNYIDVCIDDIYVDRLRDIKLKWRGSSNQRVIDVNKTLENGCISLYCD